jgi:ribose transport system substrate-binding protein
MRRSLPARVERNKQEEREVAFRITKARPSRTAFAASVVTGVALLVGSSASAATVKPDKVTTSTSGGCGTVPYVAPDAPNHVLSTLPKAYAASYTGFTDYPIVKSAWANWKPKKKSGFNVQIVWLPENNPVDNAELDAVVGALQASGKVKTIQVQQPSSDTDVAGQLQELQTAIDRKPNLIIAIPISPTSAAPLVDQAGKEGIPTVVPSIGLPGPYDVSVYTNVYLSVAAATADVARDAGGTGSFLAVAGVPGVPNTVDAVNAWTDVLKRCPNISIASTVNGYYQSAATQGAVQQFLGTHPSPLSGIVQAGTMGTGIFAAYAQAGDSAPSMADTGATQGSLDYWYTHSSYKGAAVLLEAGAGGATAADVALRMLAGDGVKLNTLLETPFVISTRKQLDVLWKPSWALTSTIDVSPPAGTYFPTSYLNAFFKH